MGDFVEALGALDAKKAELESRIKAAEPKGAKDAEGDDSDAAEGDAGDRDDDTPPVDEAALKALKKDLAAVKKQLKARWESFTTHIDAAVDSLTPESAADLLLTILHDDMRGIVERYIAAQRKAIVAAVENWWDKYRVTLTQLEGRRDEAAHALRHYLNELRYV